MTQQIGAIRGAMLHLGTPLNELANAMGKRDFSSCATFIEDAKPLVDALDKLVHENPIADRLSTQITRLSGAIREAANLTWKDPTQTEIYKSTIIAVQAARSEFVTALNRLEL
jgi:hypothetical protein